MRISDWSSDVCSSDLTTTYASKLGSWFSKQSSPKASSPSHPSSLEADDPLLTLDMQSALFPYGPVDPLNPASFNDLLSAAEALISTYQNAYRPRVTTAERRVGKAWVSTVKSWG